MRPKRVRQIIWARLRRYVRHVLGEERETNRRSPLSTRPTQGRVRCEERTSEHVDGIQGTRDLHG
jgi:hypothetical protein